MSLTDAQKEKLKGLSAEDRAELLMEIGGKTPDADLLKTVEILQGKVEAMEKASKRKGTEERRGKGGSWFDTIFGGA